MPSDYVLSPLKRIELRVLLPTGVWGSGDAGLLLSVLFHVWMASSLKASRQGRGLPLDG